MSESQERRTWITVEIVSDSPATIPDVQEPIVIDHKYGRTEGTVVEVWGRFGKKAKPEPKS